MKPNNLGPVDWSYEYRNQTVLWSEQCKKRWALAERMIHAGHHLVLLHPLSKSYARKGALQNPITTIETLRNNVEGKYHDYNYGIVTGQGRCTVIDLDGKNKKNGLRAYADLGVRHGFDSDPVSRVFTPSGEHHYYAYSDLIRGTSPFASDGIDICNSDGDRATLHVVGPGSVYYDASGRGGVYEEDLKCPIMSVSMLPQIPAEFLDLVLAERNNNVVDLQGRPLEIAKNGRGTADDEDTTTYESVKEMLGVIDCSSLSYNDWMNVGRALHYWDEEHAFEYWREWSETDPDRYDFKVCCDKWEGFKTLTSRKPVTIATLYKMAMDRGYTPNKKQKSMGLFAYMDEHHPIIALDVAKHIRLNANGGYTLHTTKDLENSTPSLWTFDHKGKEWHPAKQYLKWADRTVYDDIGYYPPGGRECPDSIFNVWQGFNVEPEPGDIERYLELFDAMFGLSSAKEWIHDWLAHMIQRPGEKITTALVLHGPQGSGKNTLMSVFQTIFKPFNTMEFNNTDSFLSKFNDIITCVNLAVVNEASWAGNHKHFSLMKGYVADEYFMTEEKFVKMRQKRNVARFVIMTNESWVVPADHDDRRFAVIEVPTTRPVADPWWMETRRMFRDPKFAGHVMHWYQNRKISHNLFETPKTESLERQKQITKLKQRSDTNKLYLEVLLRLLRWGNAVHRSVPGGWEGYMISSNMIARAYRMVSNENYADSFNYEFRLYLQDDLKIPIKSGVRARYKQEQRMVTIWPDIPTVLKHLQKYERIPADDVICPENWSEEGIEW